MLINCPREALLSALQVVNIVVPTKSTSTVYMNVKAIATADKLTLIATDLEVGIRYEMAGLTIEDPGEALLPINRLMSILRESSDENVHIDADPKRCRVNMAFSEYEMPAEDPAAFANVAEFDEDDLYHELAAGDLQRMIRRVAFAAATDEGKYAMRAVLWDIQGKKATLVATDGKRLAICEGPCVKQGDGKHNPNALVPPKAMKLLDRILGEGDASQPVRVCLTESAALVKTDRATIYSRLVEGRYPPYASVIPKKYNATVDLKVGVFASHIRQAAIMTDQESKRIEFDFKKSKLVLAAAGSTTGKSKVTMPLEGYEGDPVKISFDPLYITEMLRIMDGADVVKLNLVDKDKSVTFTKGDDYLYLVVPLV